MRRQDTARGFTLIEMLVTLAIMVLVIGISIPIVATARASARRSDAVNSVRGALAAAREAAVERRTVVAIEFVSSTDVNRGDVMILTDKSVDVTGDRRIGNPIALPDFIKFSKSIATEWTLENGWDGDPDDLYDPSGNHDIAYKPDGTVADTEGTTDLALWDTVDDLRIVLRVLPATGLVVEAWHLQDPLLPEGPTNPRDRGWL
ncbi:MAG: type II secretion system protein [Planctomycetota bacterium]|jgi:prepilin-type N-terminal cleavage/methylation domain-containing protein